MRKLLSAVVAATLTAGTAGAVFAVSDETKDKMRHPIRTMKEKMRNADTQGVAPAATERPNYPRRPGDTRQAGTPEGAAGASAGAASAMASGRDGDMSDRYAADRERTRERARQWAQEHRR